MDNIGDENLPHSFTHVSGSESDMEWNSTPIVVITAQQNRGNEIISK